MSDIPYGDYFTVEERWIVRPLADGQWKGCEFIASVELKFCKYTMFKGTIVSRGKKDIKEANDLWVTMCTEHLQTATDQRRERIGTIGHEGEGDGDRKSSGGSSSSSIRRRRGGNSRSHNSNNSNRREERGDRNSRSHNSSNVRGPNVLVVYAWGLAVLSLLMYMCREMMALRREMNRDVETCNNE